MSAIDQLIRVAREYARATDLELKTVSWRLFEDTKKLEAMIEGGADIQVRRLEKAMQWFSANWPSGAVWPDDIRRPELVDPTPRADNDTPTHGEAA